MRDVEVGVVVGLTEGAADTHFVLAMFGTDVKSMHISCVIATQYVPSQGVGEDFTIQPNASAASTYFQPKSLAGMLWWSFLLCLQPSLIFLQLETASAKQ